MGVIREYNRPLTVTLAAMTLLLSMSYIALATQQLAARAGFAWDKVENLIAFGSSDCTDGGWQPHMPASVSVAPHPYAGALAIGSTWMTQLATQLRRPFASGVWHFGRPDSPIDFDIYNGKFDRKRDLKSQIQDYTTSLIERERPWRSDNTLFTVYMGSSEIERPLSTPEVETFPTAQETRELFERTQDSLFESMEYLYKTGARWFAFVNAKPYTDYPSFQQDFRPEWRTDAYVPIHDARVELWNEMSMIKLEQWTLAHPDAFVRVIDNRAFHLELRRNWNKFGFIPTGTNFGLGVKTTEPIYQIHHDFWHNAKAVDGYYSRYFKATLMAKPGQALVLGEHKTLAIYAAAASFLVLLVLLRKRRRAFFRVDSHPEMESV